MQLNCEIGDKSEGIQNSESDGYHDPSGSPKF
jgi:hypothetical protein